MVNYYYPETHYSRKDKFGQFLKHHENRFSYILYNKVDSLSEIASIYPDTLRIKKKFCQSVLKNSEIHDYFTDLSPRALTTWKLTHHKYSVDEMMIVASRFFYVDKIDETDTTIERRICIGISGMSELQQNRDMTLLEAFTFEAIFYYLLKNKTPQFETNFDHYVAHALEAKKKVFQSFEKLLMTVRNECYVQMSKNEDLKRRLIRYYKKNRNNLNFEITETGI